jgi:hypothetical protein
MASRFVANWYRRITIAQASSSISTFVRAMHKRYTTGLQVGKPNRLRREALVEAAHRLHRRGLWRTDCCDDGEDSARTREIQMGRLRRLMFLALSRAGWLEPSPA